MCGPSEERMAGPARARLCLQLFLLHLHQYGHAATRGYGIAGLLWPCLLIAQHLLAMSRVLSGLPATVIARSLHARSEVL